MKGGGNTWTSQSYHGNEYSFYTELDTPQDREENAGEKINFYFLSEPTDKNFSQ